jgi:hypothetical protein
MEMTIEGGWETFAKSFPASQNLRSFVKYNGFGFWSRDSYIGSWLTAMLSEMNKLPQLDPWLKSISEDWRGQIEIDGGCMDLGLDEFIIDCAKEKVLLLIAERALEQCKPEEYRTGQLFIDLLRGKLKTIESSPVDYI